MKPELQMIPLAKLKLSPTVAQRERRAHFDADGIAELAESIKNVGMLAPIIARPWHSPVGLNHLVTDPDFEIVAGERRYLAAKKAGLEQVPVTVRDLTDEQLLEVQLVENLQREDLHELAEAEGYEGLAKLGHTVDEMADKVGKSKATVYARMKLLALCKEARKAFYDGKLTSSTALLLARIPGEQLQKEALKAITTPRWSGDAMSVREASKHVHDNYMLRLGSAGFKTEDATLVPAAGACGACPKRTGNQPELFGDVKGADVCTDPTCFKAKLAAHAGRAIAEAEKSGQTVIAGAAVKKVAPYGLDSQLTGYVRLDDHDYSSPKNRTYRQILGKDFTPTLLHDKDSGKMVELAPVSALPAPARRSASTDDSRQEQKAQERRRQLELAYRAELLRRIHESSFADDADQDLRLACEAMFDRLHHDATKRLFKVMGWEPSEKKDKYRGAYKEYDSAPILKAAKTESELWRLLRILAVAGDLEFFGHQTTKDRTDRLHKLATRVGIKPAKVEAELAAAAKAKKKPAPSKASKKKAARKAK